MLKDFCHRPGDPVRFRLMFATEGGENEREVLRN